MQLSCKNKITLYPNCACVNFLRNLSIIHELEPKRENMALLDMESKLFMTPLKEWEGYLPRSLSR
jgi:hypothetical protein